MNDSTRETVLVTGGTGFVAGWCIVELLRRGYAVRTTVRSLAKEAAVRAAVASAGVDGASVAFFPADLTKDAGWDAAMAGSTYVLHVASPLGTDGSADADALLAAAREGTIRVLGAAIRAGVKRVVMTSSTAASTPAPPSAAPADETVWTDTNGPNLTPYRQSKILAERAAWDFMATQKTTTMLTTILPGAVFGPVLLKDNLGSVQVIHRLLSGRLPAVPRLGFAIVDVRDLAALHVAAMIAPEAAGQRFIAVGDFMWMIDVAKTLRTELGDRAAKVPTPPMPDFVVRLLALFVPAMRYVKPLLGRTQGFSSAKAKRILAFAPRAGAATVVDCANSLLD